MATKAGDKTVYNANTNWDNEEKYLTNLAQSGNNWAAQQLAALQEAKAQYTQPQSYAQAKQPTVNYQQTYAQATQPSVNTQPTGNYNHSLDGGKTWITAAQSLAKKTGVTEQQAQMLLDQGGQTGTTYDVIMQQARQMASDSLYEKYITDRYNGWLKAQGDPSAYVYGIPFDKYLEMEGGMGEAQRLLQNGYEARNNNISVTPLAAQTYADILQKVTGGNMGGGQLSEAFKAVNNVQGNTWNDVAGNYQSTLPVGSMGNKQTTTYIDENGDKQTGVVANSSYLDSMLNQLNQQYQQQIAQADNAAAAATKKAILALEEQKNKLNQQYQGMYEQLYLNRRMNEKALPEQLAAMGYTGGLTESALLQLQNNYQNNVRQGEVARMQGVLDLDAAIAEAQLTGDLERANALMELSGQFYNNYAQAMQALQDQANWQQQFNYQQAMAAREQQELQREQLAENSWVLLENGIMPNASGLAAMGLTAEQAQALLATLGGEPQPNPEPDDPPVGPTARPEYGEKYSMIWKQARSMYDRGSSAESIMAYLDKFNEAQLTDAGLEYIMNSLNLGGYRTGGK